MNAISKKLTLGVTTLALSLFVGCASTPMKTTESRKIASVNPITEVLVNLTKHSSGNEETVSKKAAEFFTSPQAEKMGIKFEGDASSVKSIDDLMSRLGKNSDEDVEKFLNENADTFAKQFFKDEEKSSLLVKAIRNPEDAATAWKKIDVSVVSETAANRFVPKTLEKTAINTATKDVNEIVAGIHAKNVEFETITGIRPINSANCEQLSIVSKKNLWNIQSDAVANIKRDPASVRLSTEAEDVRLAKARQAWEDAYKKDLALTDSEAKAGMKALAGCAATEGAEGSVSEAFVYGACKTPVLSPKFVGCR